MPADGEATDARFFPLDALPPMSRVYAERLEVVLADRVEAVLGRDWLGRDGTR